MCITKPAKPEGQSSQSTNVKPKRSLVPYKNPFENKTVAFKGLVHPKMKLVSVINPPHVVPNHLQNIN